MIMWDKKRGGTVQGNVCVCMCVCVFLLCVFVCLCAWIYFMSGIFFLCKVKFPPIKRVNSIVICHLCVCLRNLVW